MNSTLVGQKRKQSPTKKELEAKVAKLEEAIITVQRIAISPTRKLIHELESSTYYGEIDVLYDQGKISSREEWESKNPIASTTFYEFKSIFEVMEMDINSYVSKLDLEINKPFQSQETLSPSNRNQIISFFDGNDSDSEFVLSSSDDNDSIVDVVTNKNILNGWSFKMNTTTYNSFILAPNVPVQQLTFDKDTKQVSWPNGSMPAAWNLFFKELERNVFYVDVYKGWIVSLRLEDKMLELGAVRKE